MLSLAVEAHGRPAPFPRQCVQCPDLMQRRPIQQLPANLVNRIAAGEVIERPASVVKELLENALDAGATHITVEIEEGGQGPHPHHRQRLAAFHRPSCPWHLPSTPPANSPAMRTCSESAPWVSGARPWRASARYRMPASSAACPGDDAAYEIQNRGGTISDPQATAGNVGTTVEVRNLFFNTPARRKFLKGSPTELGHISEMVLRTALPYPGSRFELISSGRSVLKLPAEFRVERLLAAWPDEFREQRLMLDVRDAEIQLHGVIGLPDLARPTAKYQYTYLNGRYIRDKFLQHAVREAYRGLTEPGRHPAAILLITMPPRDVDVNVHPTKIEVRFRDSGRLHGLVLAEIREKLLGSDLAPSAVVPSRPTVRTTVPVPEPEPREKLADFFRQHFPDEGSSPSPAAQPAPAALPGAPGFFDAPQPTQGSIDFPSPAPARPPVDVAAIGRPSATAPAAEPAPRAARPSNCTTATSSSRAARAWRSSTSMHCTSGSCLRSSRSVYARASSSRSDC